MSACKIYVQRTSCDIYIPFHHRCDLTIQCHLCARVYKTNCHEGDTNNGRPIVMQLMNCLRGTLRVFRPSMGWIGRAIV